MVVIKGGRGKFMSITFPEVSSHINGIKDDLRSAMDSVSRSILNARDETGLPVYSIKSRVKNPESAYLKTKRKNYTSLDQITDYAGIRILCLFERNIYEINKFLLHYLKKDNLTIIELKVFNFDADAFDKIKCETDSLCLADCLKPLVEKKSGYKSLHYLVATQIVGKEIKIEMQLRTLLQDVWGELEHSLSYKRGGIHPHIKKSFELLSQDLQTTDTLMEHLKDINEKEENGERYSKDKSGPRYYLDYEDDLLPQAFTGHLKEEYEAYHVFVKGINFRDRANYSLNVTKAKEYYDVIAKKITAMDLRDSNLYYWHEMENAYYLFCEAQYDEALVIYTNVMKKHPEKYCLHFRVGELYMKMGEVEKALAEFDESERIIAASCDYKNKNLYHIKVMLALIYWMLGDEYIDISLEEIREAEEIYRANTDDFPDKFIYEALVNNICWYHLTKFIITQQGVDFDSAVKKFEMMEALLLEDDKYNLLSCNALILVHGFITINTYTQKMMQTPRRL